MKHDELMPPRPGRRNWTRAEDYLPPRRIRRSPGHQLPATLPSTAPGSKHPAERVSLGIVPFVLMMVGLGILALGIAIIAWPGRHLPPPAERLRATAPPSSAETTLTLSSNQHR